MQALKDLRTSDCWSDAGRDEASAEACAPKARAAQRPPSPPPRAASNPFRAQRDRLPVAEQRDQLLGMIGRHQVVFVEGETGSGKSTQVAQFVLEQASEHQTPCSIVCTQPRRISALGVSERVAAERGESIGGTVGYSIRFDTRASSATALLFCTTGLLLRRLESERDLPGVTHLFIDEVHERSVESDLLLLVVRDLLRRRADLKLVLMSATMDSERLAGYFGGAAPPSVRVPGRTFPVTALYLEDALEWTGHCVPAGAEWARHAPTPRPRRRIGSGHDGDRRGSSSEGAGDDGNGGEGVEGEQAVRRGSELGERHSLYSEATRRSLSLSDAEKINFDLIVALLRKLRAIAGPRVLSAWSHASQRGCTPAPALAYACAKEDSVGGGIGGSDGGNRAGRGDGDEAHSGGGDEADHGADDRSGGERGVVVFLPGSREIQRVLEMLQSTAEFGAQPQREWVLPLHSLLSPEEQRRVFERPPAGVQKVVLATNIAETSITIDDAVYVIDTCRMREKRFDAAKSIESLQEVLISRANAHQRRGRAGRCRPGFCFHLLSRHTLETVCPAHQQPEIQRTPLQRVVLSLKALGYHESAAAVCGRLLEPPPAPAVVHAVEMLTGLDAMEKDGDGERLTALGHHLARLPTDVRLGKLCLLGAIFGVVDESLTIAAILSHRSLFASPPAGDDREAADAAKAGFAGDQQSDHLAALAAYSQFDALPGAAKYSFARKHLLSIPTLQGVGAMKRRLLELLSDVGMVPSGLDARRVESIGRRAGGSDGVAAALQHLSSERAPRARPAPRSSGATAANASAKAAFDVAHALQTKGPLLKALLCAALYPQLLIAEDAGAGGGGAKGGGKGAGRGGMRHDGRPPRLLAREGATDTLTSVRLHPSSVIASTTRFESRYLVYAERVRTTQVFVRDASPVSAYALMLFGGRLNTQRLASQAEDTVRLLIVDDFIRFRVRPNVEALVVEARRQLASLLRAKLRRPALQFTDVGQGILAAVTALLAVPPPASPGPLSASGNQLRESLC